METKDLFDCLEDLERKCNELYGAIVLIDNPSEREKEISIFCAEMAAVRQRLEQKRNHVIENMETVKQLKSILCRKKKMTTDFEQFFQSEINKEVVFTMTFSIVFQKLDQLAGKIGGLVNEKRI